MHFILRYCGKYTPFRIAEICRAKTRKSASSPVPLFPCKKILAILSAHFQGGTMRFEEAAESWFGKKAASGEREIPIPEKLLAWLKERAKGEPPEAPLVTRDPRTMQNHFQRFLKAAGISEGAHIHTLRHTFATHSLSAGADLKTLSATLGHASTHTTLDLYVHPTFESKRRLQEAFRQFIAHPEKWGRRGGHADWGGCFGKGRPFG